MRSRASSMRSGVATETGAYAPMPPVLGPVSPSPTRLWSCDGRRSTTSSPSVTPKIESSSPSMNSSTTTFRPASPKARSSIMAVTAERASSTFGQTTAPLPAASPDALTTTGAPVARTWSRAAPGSVKVR